MAKKINIGLVFGGRSGEHEVSLKSAKEVRENLDKERYNIIPIAITKKGKWLIGHRGDEYMTVNLPKTEKEGGISVEQSQSLVTTDENRGLAGFSEGEASHELDIIFPIGHGSYMEDGRMQGMLDMLGIPYVFSGTLASALAMNKQKTKLVAKNAGLKIAKEVTLLKNQKYNVEKIIKKLGLPIVVKPTESGSSVGMSICKEKSELENALSKAFEYSNEVMLEQFIKGRELTVAVLGNKKIKALPVIEIIPKVSEFFSYEAKYQQGGSDEICPADIPEDVRKKVQRYSLKIFRALDCKDLARTDFIWDEANNRSYFLEINTIPGMTGTSLAPKAAKAAGMSFPQFLDKLIELAIRRAGKE
jgi:D-alanine-D-alanine ligase